MRSIFAALAVAVSVATTYAETPTPADGTVSVLKAAAVQPSTSTSAPATAPVVQASACEEARVVKLAPWQVRRLNRVADRQEAREARKCCDACSCKKDDCCQKTLVLESRRKEKCDCCCK